MTALCDYEVERAQRVAENKRRMEEMGLLKVHGPTMHTLRARSLVVVSGPLSSLAPPIASRCRTARERTPLAEHCLQSLMHRHCALKQP